MKTGRGRAVVATAFLPEADRLRAQLVDLGFEEVACASNGLQALRCVKDRRPDALVADAVMPSLDGVGLILRINETPLTVIPAAALLTAPGMKVRDARIAGLCAVLEKPTETAALESALNAMVPEKRPVNAQMRARAESILKYLGVPEHPGREYLTRAILIARQDARFLSALTMRLYPAVAEIYGKDQRHVERAMRHVIDAAWRSGEMEAQYKIFGDTIDARRGNPTCGEMIAQVADILRWEGHA